MNKSESIGTLAGALAKAQGAMGAAVKDNINPAWKSKYADLASIVAAIKEPFAANGLAYVQATDIDETGGVIVETALLHASGEWISSRLRMTPTKQDPQGVGSCITYARRYGLQALVGVPADDDDGNAATGADREVEVNKGNTVKQTTDSKRFSTPRPEPAPDAPHPAADAPRGLASEAQVKAIWAISRKLEWVDIETREWIAMQFDDKKVAGLTKDEASRAITALQKILEMKEAQG